MSAENQTIDLSKVNAAELYRELSARDGFRVLRKCVQRREFRPLGDEPKLKALILDTETTGLDFRRHEVIEVGGVLVEVGVRSGNIGRVLGLLKELEQPTTPIPAEVTAINNITNEMVAGLKFDEARIRAAFDACDFVIAHNAQFDRGFIDERFPGLDKPWTCSIDDLNWKEHGYLSNALEVISMENGFFYDAHRAVDDCYALAYTLGTPMKKGGQMPMLTLIESMKKQQFNVIATAAPFEKKDLLKARGYRFDGETKLWSRAFSGNDEDFDREHDFLAESIYARANAVFHYQVKSHNERYGSFCHDPVAQHVFDPAHPFETASSAPAA